jgi:predicted phage terminase large subunit-like protein
VHVVIGVDPENRMYLLDLWRGQTSSDVWIEAWCDLVTKWRPSFWAEEQGQIISGVGPFLQRRAIERHAYTRREQFPSRGDKAVRARSISGRMAMLGLYVRQGAPWFSDLRAELLSFPVGTHDDQVDALGLVGQLLDKISADRGRTRPTCRNAMATGRRSRKCRTIVGRRCEEIECRNGGARGRRAGGARFNGARGGSELARFASSLCSEAGSPLPELRGGVRVSTVSIVCGRDRGSMADVAVGPHWPPRPLD